MSERKKIYSAHIYNPLGPVKKVIKELQELMNEFGDDISLTKDYVGVNEVTFITKSRYETDQEYEWRLNQERQFEENSKKIEYETYLKLKEKYEGVKDE